MTFSDRVDGIFAAAEAIAHSGFSRLAPALTPLAPAGFFALAAGLGVYEKTEDLLPQWAAVSLSIAIGLAAALGLEAAGYKAFGSAINAFQAGLGWASFILPALYVIIGIAVVWLVESSQTAVLGTCMFLLSGAVYASRMISDHVNRLEEAAVAEAQRLEDETKKESERETAVEDDQTKWERQQRQLQAERDHAIKLAEIESEKAVMLARASREPAESQRSQLLASTLAAEPAKAHECEFCKDGRKFSRSGLNAHYRHCKVRNASISTPPVLNGHK